MRTILGEVAVLPLAETDLGPPHTEPFARVLYLDSCGRAHFKPVTTPLIRLSS